MFTGIVQHSGRLRGFAKGRTELLVEAPGLAVEIGGSVAVNGVCLSVIRREDKILAFNLSQETLSRTTLGRIKPEAALNLEMPLTLSAPLGGHLMSGHVDFVGTLKRVQSKAPGKRLVFGLSPEFRPYFIPKGSVAVDGVSLTVAALARTAFEVELIPVTLDKSNLSSLRPGAEVNVECDMVGKYVYNWISQGKR
ncbi:MAG: riboflavin synthase [Candidatus Aminicenantales bacterium]|jgi:riboflavin synthase